MLHGLAGQHWSCAAVRPCRPSTALALPPPPCGAVANRSHDFLCVFPFNPMTCSEVRCSGMDGASSVCDPRGADVALILEITY